nr:hypothetical protein HK105_001104 [Polyrhizophydium stewartii]
MTLGRSDSALSSFERGGEFVAAQLAAAGDADSSVEQEPDQWIFWSEELLFQLCMHLIRAKRSDSTSQYLRLYLQLVSAVPSTYEPTKRIAVMRQYLLSLFSALPETTVFSGVTQFDLTVRHSPETQDKIATVYHEIRKFLGQYERLLTTLSPFPRGEDSTEIANERSARVLEAYDMWVKAEVAYAHRSEDSRQDIVDRHYHLLETLYRGTKHTFQSLRILRYIAHTFLSLLVLQADEMPTDERKEAECAVAAYVFYWEKKSTMMLEQERKHLEDVAASVSAAKSAASSAAAAADPPTTAIAASNHIKHIKDMTFSQSNKVGAASPRLGSLPRVTMGSTESLPPPSDIIVVVPVNGSAETNGYASSVADSVPESPQHSLKTAVPPPTILLEPTEAATSESETTPQASEPPRLPDRDPSLSVICQPIILKSVEGDSPVDAIGVLITGMRVLLYNHGGDLDKLQQAALYGEKAYYIATQHTAHLPKYTEILRRVYQWLGVVYGEHALEVTSGKERRRLQSEAIAMLQKAAAIDDKDHMVHYQLALQLAEAGEFGDAVDAINQSIRAKPDFPNAYNLLALLMNSKAQNDRALQVIREGWRVCVIKFAKEQVIKAGKKAASLESMITWDSVPAELRDDLINLKLTQVALEHERFGPRATIETILSLFTLVKHVVGLPQGLDDKKSGESRRRSADFLPGLSEARGMPMSPSMHSINTNSTGLNGLAASQSRGSNAGQPSPARQPAPPGSSTNVASQAHRFRAFDLLISLWITTSAVYRELQDFEGARQAVEEAEQLAEVLGKTELRIASAPSRLFREASSLPLSSSHVSLSGASRMRISKPARVRRVSSGELRGPSGQWGFANRCVRRILADIAFEQAMIQYDIYRLQNQPPVTSKYAKYLSPVAKVEAERQSQLRKSTRMPLSRSNVSISSSVTNSTTNPTNGDNIMSTGMLSLEMGVPPGIFSGAHSTDDMVAVHHQRLSIIVSPPTNPPRNGSTTSGSIGGVSGGRTSSSSHARNIQQQQALMQQRIAQLASLPRVSLDQIITAVQYISIIDPDHLPTRVHLGILFIEKGELGIAEHWLGRACSHAKFRGAGGGRSGSTTVFGGATAVWGWLAWRNFSLVMRSTNRHSDAKQSIFFSMDLEKIHCVRGYECLARFTYSL